MNGPGQGVPNGILQFANLEFGVSGNKKFVISACESECHDESEMMYIWVDERQRVAG